MAALNAAASSVVPSPLAPKSRTLTPLHGKVETSREPLSKSGVLAVVSKAEALICVAPFGPYCIGLASNPGHSNSWRSEEHTSELQSRLHIVCRLLLEKKKINRNQVRSL